MPPVLRFLCVLLGVVTLAKIITLGVVISPWGESDQSIIRAAAIAATGLVSVVALLVSFFTRFRHSLFLLRTVVVAVAVSELAFYFLGGVTPFEEASPLLKFQLILEWVEVFTCIALTAVLRAKTTQTWFFATST